MSRASAVPAGIALPRGVTFKRTFAALQHRNYKLWFYGQLVSLVGTWMQATAQAFLIFELTHSAAYLGYVGFAAGVPTALFTLYGGVVSDRRPRRTVLIWSQTAMMGLAALLATLAFAGRVQPWHILVLAFGLGVANAFDAPARQAFVSELVARDDLTNAIALNATMFNAATAVGPAAAGVAYHFWGPGWCFALNALSFVAVIAALAMMRLEPMPRRTNGRSAHHELREAIAYVGRDRVVRTLIALVGAMSLFGLSVTTVIPAWAVRMLRGNATTNGWLLSARGAGSIAAALFIASLGRFRFKGRLLTVGTFAVPVALAGFSLSRTLAQSAALLGAVGAAVILVNNLSNALVQTHVPDDLRGRVMSVYTLVFFSGMPIGALWIGGAADRLGEPTAIGLGSIFAFAAALVLWRYEPDVRALP